MAVLLARHNTVVGLDLDAPRIDRLRRGESPIHDDDISRFLAEEDLDVTFTTDAEEAHAGADFVIIATPTNYDPVTNYFDTSSIEAVMRDVHPDRARRHDGREVDRAGGLHRGRARAARDRRTSIFSPEFLREGRALHDNLHPARIVVGEDSERARAFADLLRQGRRRRRRPRALHRAHRGRGDQALRQHLPRDAGRLLQRARLLRPVPRPRQPRRSSTASASTRGSAPTTTTRPSATAATACPRTPSSCWPTTPTSRRR